MNNVCLLLEIESAGLWDFWVRKMFVTQYLPFQKENLVNIIMEGWF